MNKPTTRPWWASLGFSAAEPEPDTDYADMGTAFGLDASMAPRPADGDGAKPGSADSPAPHAQGSRPR